MYLLRHSQQVHREEDGAVQFWRNGHLLQETEANRGFIKYTMDLLSLPIPENGNRYGKAPENKENYLAHKLKKRCIKKHFKGIHDRFL